MLRYKAWVTENLCQRSQDVKGVIVCKEPGPRNQGSALPRLFFVTGGFFHGLRVGSEAQFGQACGRELAMEGRDIA